jgi:sulfur carrier protein ThiS
VTGSKAGVSLAAVLFSTLTKHRHDSRLAAMESESSGVVIVEILPVADDDSLIKVPLRPGLTLESLQEELKLPEEKEVVMVNGAYVKPDYLLQDGDRVSVFPFMSGG